MFKQVYLYDGTPYLAFKNDEGEYQYPNDEYTEVAPPEGIYQPFYFDGSEWIGATREEWEAQQEKPEPTEPQPIEKVTANMQMQLMKSNIAQLQLQKQNAQMMMEITKLKGGN